MCCQMKECLIFAKKKKKKAEVSQWQNLSLINFQSPYARLRKTRFFFFVFQIGQNKA